MKTDRRSFLKQTAAVASMGVSPLMANLAAITNASAQSASDFKALVCIFLAGGNDQANTLIPLPDYHYDRYMKARPSFYVDRDGVSCAGGARELPRAPIPKGFSYPNLTEFPDFKSPLELALNASGAPHGWFGLHPALSSLHILYNEGLLAPILNVGTLIEPTIGVDRNGTIVFKKTPVKDAEQNYAPLKDAALPPQRESHNDQQAFWQAMAPEGGVNGWGARILQKTQLADGGSNLARDFESITTASASLWSGNSPFVISSAGALTGGFSAYDDAPADEAQAIKAMMCGSDSTSSGGYLAAGTHPLIKGLMSVSRDAFRRRGDLNQADTDDSSSLEYEALDELIKAGNGLPDQAMVNGLAKQLKAVTRMLRTNERLPNPPKRQVFFVSLGGFDTHGATVQSHTLLLQHLGQAMLAFQRTLQCIGMSNQVTTFTASDFGRTLSGNGDGTDHGWGGHHFVMGGAVRGGEIYGVPPQLGDKAKTLRKTPEQTYADYGRGRLIPTISVDQYAATLGSWMGVTDSDLLTVFPNLKNFGASGWPKKLSFI